MRFIPPVLIALALAIPAPAQDIAAAPAETQPDVPAYGPFEITDQTLADYLWLNRLVVVFADTPRDPAFVRQMDLILARPEALAERDVVVLTDTDPEVATAIRTSLRPRGFALVIVDKDGRVAQRKPSPWDVREISRAIDKTPLRQEELRDARDRARSAQ